MGSITISNNILTLQWFPSAGGDTPTGFTVRLFSSPTPKANGMIEVATSPINAPGSTANSVNYTGTYGLYYRFYVVAYNAAGNSSASAYSSTVQIPYL